VKQGLVLELTVDGKMTASSLDTPLLPWTSRPWHVAQESVLNTCRHLLERFRAGRDADISGADNLKTYALAEAAYESAATGRAVAPPDEAAVTG